MTDSERTQLMDLVERFTEAFNRDDLDATMGFFASDAIYDEFHGKRSEGVAAIRAVLEPQFRGDFGTVRFETEDLFADAGQGKVLIRWSCVITRDGDRRAWRGLDIIHIRDGQITEKHTYAKTERLLLR